MLEALHWHGPADVEFIVDDRDGEAYFIEINGRLWGTTELAIEAGMNFPALSCEMAARGETDVALSFPTGIRMRFHFRLGLFYVAQSSSKIADAWKMFGLSSRVTSDIWWTDLRPTFVLARQAWAGLQNANKPRTLSPLIVIDESDEK